MIDGPSIRDAILALDDRKHAVYGRTDGLLDETLMRRLLLGFDVDVDELYAAMGVAARVFLAGMLAGKVTRAQALASAWCDGLITGLMLAELRGRERVL